MGKIKRIGIFGNGTNVVKLAKILSKNLEGKTDVIIEILLPEGRELFGYDESNILAAISDNNLDIFEKNDDVIQNFMDVHKNVRIFKQVKIVEYYKVGFKHAVNMYVESQSSETSSREYDYFVFADKLFTISPTLEGISTDQSLANIASIDHADKIGWLFTKTRYWLDAESIVLIGNDYKTYDFAIKLREAFPELEITIINEDKTNKKPLKGYIFDFVSESFMRRMKLLKINVYLNANIVSRVVDFDTDLVSSITIKDLDTGKSKKIDTEIILIIDNVKIDDIAFQNSYFINKIVKLSNRKDFLFAPLDPQFKIDQLQNFYFINSLFYKMYDLKELTFEQQRKYIQWYGIEKSYTHIIAISSSIMADILKTPTLEIPVNFDMLVTDNVHMDIIGVESNDLQNEVMFTNGGNNLDILKHNIDVIETGILSMGDSIMNIALFFDETTGSLKNFLLETKLINFDKKDSTAVYARKRKSMSKTHREFKDLLTSFKLGDLNILNILTKFIDIFNYKYVDKMSKLIIETKLKLNEKQIKIKESNISETLEFRNNQKYDFELSEQNLYAFKFSNNDSSNEELLLEFNNSKKKGGK